MRQRQDGFTLIELMVVVLIIGILVAICIPVFTGVKKNAEQKACFSNERLVEGAYNNYVAEHGDDDMSDWASLMGKLVPGQDMRVEPKCPSGGEYIWDGQTVSCTIHGTYH